jgi:hypothetical protein
MSSNKELKRKQDELAEKESDGTDAKNNISEYTTKEKRDILLANAKFKTQGEALARIYMMTINQAVDDWKNIQTISIIAEANMDQVEL